METKTKVMMACAIALGLGLMAEARTIEIKQLKSTGSKTNAEYWWQGTEKSKSSWFQIKIGGASQIDDTSEMEIRAATVFKSAKDKKTGINDVATFKFDPINKGKAIFFMVSTGAAFSRERDSSYWYADFKTGWQLAGCIIEIWQKGKVVRHWSNMSGKDGKTKLTDDIKKLRINRDGHPSAGERYYSARDFDNATEIYSVDQKGERVDIDEVLKPFRESETTSKQASKSNDASAAKPSVKNTVASKLRTCEFLLNKKFKKNAKFYLCLFSASWCPPCRREMPRIAKTYVETLKDDPDIELIHFSRDQSDEKAMAWAKAHDVKFPVVKPHGGNPLDLHTRGIPHLFIVKADGTLLEEGHPASLFTENTLRKIKEGRMLSNVATLNGINWTYEIVGDGIVLGGMGKKRAVPETTGGVLEIPETIDGRPVREIGERAFYQCRGLTSVTIPSTVTNIEDWAFWGCTRLRSMTIPPSVKNIGDQAFYWCTSLQTVTIPDSVTNVGIWAFYANWKLTSVTIPASVVNIGKSAFCYCKGLRAIHVAGGNSAYSSLDGILYNKAQTELIQCPAGREDAVTIPSSVTNIGVRAFDSCDGLTSVAIPVSVTHVGDLAFFHCSGMSNFIVAEGNTEYCSRDGILYNKAMTKVIQCPCKKAGTVSIPSGVTTIGWCAFSNCKGLTSVEIPLSVTNLEHAAFSGCSGLTSVTIPSSVTSIGPMVFQFCGSIRSVTIPSSVTNIGQWAFRCKGLMSVTMRGERPKASTGVFLDCKKLTAIHVPANAKSWAGMKEWQGIPLVFDAEAK